MGHKGGATGEGKGKKRGCIKDPNDGLKGSEGKELSGSVRKDAGIRGGV